MLTVVWIHQPMVNLDAYSINFTSYLNKSSVIILINRIYWHFIPHYAKAAILKSPQEKISFMFLTKHTQSILLEPIAATIKHAIEGYTLHMKTHIYNKKKVDRYNRRWWRWAASAIDDGPLLQTKSRSTKRRQRRRRRWRRLCLCSGFTVVGI